MHDTQKQQVTQPVTPHPDAQLLPTKEAAFVIGCSVFFLRNSRSTAFIFGVNAPPYEKRGNRCFYRRKRLDEWNEQFKEQDSTANITAA